MTANLKILLTLLIISVLMQLSVSSVFGLDQGIIYPPDKSHIKKNKIRVIGLEKGTSKKVRILLKNNTGQKEYTASVTNGAFSKLIELSEGSNSITLLSSSENVHHVFYSQSKTPPSGYSSFVLHSNNEITEKCALCHIPAINGKVEYKFVEQKLSCITSKCHNNFGNKESKHGPFADNKCIECHNPHGSEHKNFTMDVRAKLCFRCHEEAQNMLSSGAYIHFPITKGECLSCHEHHESNLSFHLKRNTILELCLGCHTRTIIEHEVMHEPVESGDCNACHSPHISEYKGLLYEGGEDLCLTCHEVRKEEFKSKYVHEPVAKDCNLCHDPHGSSAPSHLKTPKDKDGKYLTFKQPLTELCLGCHRKLDPQVAKQIVSSKVAHKPVQNGECTECHTPHSTNFAKQLKAPLKEICFGCHPKIKKRISESLYTHGPVQTNDCAQCHLVHGANQKYLLRARYSQKYQGKYDPKNFELCFGCHNSKVVEDKNNLDTGFRNGSTNLHFVHVHDEKKGRFCITCHDTHASDQEKHIRKSFKFKRKFKITLDFTKTATGGGCVVGCHKPRKYDRETPVK